MPNFGPWLARSVGAGLYAKAGLAESLQNEERPFINGAEWGGFWFARINMRSGVAPGWHVWLYRLVQVGWDGWLVWQNLGSREYLGQCFLLAEGWHDISGQ